MENCLLSFEEADRITGHQSIILLNEMRKLMRWYYERYGKDAENDPMMYNAYIPSTAFTAGRVSGIREERARKKATA